MNHDRIVQLDVLNGLGSKFLSGCRIPVVRMVWDHVDRVRFSAPRQKRAKRFFIVGEESICILSDRESKSGGMFSQQRKRQS